MFKRFAVGMAVGYVLGARADEQSGHDPITELVERALEIPFVERLADSGRRLVQDQGKRVLAGLQTVATRPEQAAPARPAPARKAAPARRMSAKKATGSTRPAAAKRAPGKKTAAKQAAATKRAPATKRAAPAPRKASTKRAGATKAAGRPPTRATRRAPTKQR
ncbi:MAG: histone [Acidimicrobiales bacterium]